MTHLRSGRILAASLLAASATFLLPGCGGTEAPIAEEEAAARLRVPRKGMGLAVPASAHSIHTNDVGMQCTDCHTPHGGSFVSIFRFPAAAYIPGGPAPSLDAATHTCSNVACHMVPAGTYAYWAIGGDGEPYVKEAAYGGPVTTPPWTEAMRGACRACHASPPSPAAGAWHSPTHGGGGARAACSLCHPNINLVNGDLVLTGTTHKNGVVDVAPRWKSSCFGCH
jgi:predicted CxxxxCH...CXXCH cytochrome family protein